MTVKEEAVLVAALPLLAVLYVIWRADRTYRVLRRKPL